MKFIYFIWKLYIICIIFAKNIIVMAQTTMSLRIDNNLKNSFDSLCDNFGLSSSAALTLFMKAVVRERKIPFEIKADSREEIKGRALTSIEKMLAISAKNGNQDMSLEEINEIISGVRNGK